MEDNNKSRKCAQCEKTLSTREYASDETVCEICVMGFIPTMKVLREMYGVTVKDWVNGVLQ